MSVVWMFIIQKRICTDYQREMAIPGPGLWWCMVPKKIHPWSQQLRHLTCLHMFANPAALPPMTVVSAWVEDASSAASWQHWQLGVIRAYLLISSKQSAVCVLIRSYKFDCGASYGPGWYEVVSWSSCWPGWRLLPRRAAIDLARWGWSWSSHPTTWREESPQRPTRENPCSSGGFVKHPVAVDWSNSAAWVSPSRCIRPEEALKSHWGHKIPP